MNLLGIYMIGFMVTFAIVFEQVRADFASQGSVLERLGLIFLPPLINALVWPVVLAFKLIHTAINFVQDRWPESILP